MSATKKKRSENAYVWLQKKRERKTQARKE
jgi:hypothetical protein